MSPSGKPTATMEGIDRYLTLPRGMRLHYVEWGPADGPPLVLLHGWMDIARSWDQVAPALARRFRVMALDFRGHGLSDWVGGGGYYHFPNYIFDVEMLVAEVAGGGPIVLVGHSMGGMVASLYVGTFPEKVSRFVNIEGFGPPDSKKSDAPERFAQWVASARRQLGKQARPYPTLEEAAQKLRKTNPRLPEAFSLHLARHGMEQGGDGAWRWRFDPLHKAHGPQPFYLEQALSFWRRIACPTLVCVGEHSVFKSHIPDWRERVGAIAQARVVEIPGAGHMIHYERPEALAVEIDSFLR